MRNRFIVINLFIVSVLLIVFLGTRTIILNKMIHKAIASSGMNIAYKEAGFTGFKTVYITGMKIFKGTDTLLISDSILINPRLLPLLAGKKRLKELDIYRTTIHLNDTSLRMLKKQDELQVDTAQLKQHNYARLLNSIQNKMFVYIPNKVTITDSRIDYHNDSIFSAIYCHQFSYAENTFDGEFAMNELKEKSACKVKGYLYKGKHQLTATVSQLDTLPVILPYAGPKWHARIGFDTLRLSLAFNEIESDQLDLTGYTSATNLTIQHKRIGPDEVNTHNGSLHFNLHVGDRYVELDSSSVVKVNKFEFSPYLRYEKHSTSQLSFAFIRKEFEAQDLFNSLPGGLFSNFDGMETQGKLAYHMKLHVDLDQPDSIQFDSQMENLGFKITKYGVTDFRMMNGSFVHQVYENDKFIKSILVGPENLDFTTLDEISPYLRYSVLTSEDGDFFYHKGFNQKAFRESISTNLKEKRFARGGSTISMQLVKNVFLSRKKTISRKIEEAMIVWMIENLHLVNKERMFEVYLNIIELGPGIYGIKPAAHFYFNKQPGALNLKESIYLSSIIPRPKYFRFTFISNGVLRDYYSGYFKTMSSIMVRRNQITPEDTLNLTPELKLTGEAKNMLAQPQPVVNEDSLFLIDSRQGFPNDIFNQ
jgi:hypothetical protein